MDQGTRQLIADIVKCQTDSGAMFTAFDITSLVRQRGKQVRHGEVRDVVHDLYQNGSMGASYERSVVDIGAPSKPFVYHRFSDDREQLSLGCRRRRIRTIAKSDRRPGITDLSANLSVADKPLPVGRAGKTLLQSVNNRACGGHSSGPAKKLNLDASQFLPIGRDELLKAARGINLWASPWFGRRDLIPPVDDQRTGLIDRALITHGLLSPEQLAEIHEVGAEMDKHRPHQLAIRHAANLEAGKENGSRPRTKKHGSKSRRRKQPRGDAKNAGRRSRTARQRTSHSWVAAFPDAWASEKATQSNCNGSGLPVLSTPAEVAAGPETGSATIKMACLSHDRCDAPALHLLPNPQTFRRHQDT